MYTVISYKFPKLYSADREYPGREHWLMVGDTLNKSLVIFFWNYKWRYSLDSGQGQTKGPFPSLKKNVSLG